MTLLTLLAQVFWANDAPDSAVFSDLMRIVRLVRTFFQIARLVAARQDVQTLQMPDHFHLALDNGVQPGELSEVITHLAFYAGWPNVSSALTVVKDVFAKSSR